MDKGVNNTFLSMHKNERSERFVLLESLCRPERIVPSRRGLTRYTRMLSHSLLFILPRDVCVSRVSISGVQSKRATESFALPCKADQERRSLHGAWGASHSRDYVLRSNQNLGASHGQLELGGSSCHISEAIIDNTGPQHMLCWTLAQNRLCTWCARLLLRGG